MKKYSYKDYMGDNGAHIRIKMDNSQPVAISDFVNQFIGIGSQFEKFVAIQHPNMAEDSEFYVKEVRSGCIEADLVTMFIGLPLLANEKVNTVIDAMDKIQIFTNFVKDFRAKLSNYFVEGGRAKNASKSDIADWLKTTEAIANDPAGSAKLEAASFVDGKRQIEASFKFSTLQAQNAVRELTQHRHELEAKTESTQTRVLLQFVRPSVEAGKPGKKGGERGVILSLNTKTLPILYASELAEARMKHEMAELNGNPFHAKFDVSVNVEINAGGKPIAYRITELHAILFDEDDDRETLTL